MKIAPPRGGRIQRKNRPVRWATTSQVVRDKCLETERNRRRHTVVQAETARANAQLERDATLTLHDSRPADSEAVRTASGVLAVHGRHARGDDKWDSKSRADPSLAVDSHSRSRCNFLAYPTTSRLHDEAVHPYVDQSFEYKTSGSERQGYFAEALRRAELEEDAESLPPVGERLAVFNTQDKTEEPLISEEGLHRGESSDKPEISASSTEIHPSDDHNMRTMRRPETNEVSLDKGVQELPEVSLSAPPMVPKLRVSVFAAHETAIARVLETRMAGPGGDAFAISLRDALCCTASSDGFMRAKDVLEAFHIVGAGGDVTARDIANLCMGLGMDNAGRVDCRELVGLVDDVANEVRVDGPAVRMILPHCGRRHNDYFQHDIATHPTAASFQPRDADPDFAHDMRRNSDLMQTEHSHYPQVDIMPHEEQGEYDHHSPHSEILTGEHITQQNEPLGGVDRYPPEESVRPQKRSAQHHLKPPYLPVDEKKKNFLGVCSGDTAARSCRRFRSSSCRSLPQYRSDVRRSGAPRRLQPEDEQTIYRWNEEADFDRAECALSRSEAASIIAKLDRHSAHAGLPPGVALLSTVLQQVPLRCEVRLQSLVHNDKSRGVRALADELRDHVLADSSDGMGDRIQDVFGGGSRQEFREVTRRLLLSKSNGRFPLRWTTAKIVDRLFNLVDLDCDGVLSKREILVFVRDFEGAWTRGAFPDSGHGCSTDDRLVRYEPLISALIAAEDDRQLNRNLKTSSARFTVVRAVANQVRRNLPQVEKSLLAQSTAGVKSATCAVDRLRSALAAMERHTEVLRWPDFVGFLRARGLDRAVTNGDLEEVRLALAHKQSRVFDWRSFLDLIELSVSELSGKASSRYITAIARDLFTAASQNNEPFDAGIRRIFREADSDWDGYLTRRDLIDTCDSIARRQKRPLLRPQEFDGLFNYIDRDGDGVISFSELFDFVDRHVDRFSH